KMETEMSTILDYFDRLSEIDVSNVEPFHFSFLDGNTSREDLILIKKEEVKKSFPKKEGDYLKVKEVF
ncbi:MAG: aspartyl/glutamyl-tRNA amidotransferase subunit C, partial [Candidatus Pacebacteria bacterium]|nr:aspartyl/glutamyl-tRNA amidotransferase subunit C [Candidatus Paceibacterota bacterium]